MSVYVLIAIVRKRLRPEVSLYVLLLLRSFSVTVFGEKMPEFCGCDFGNTLTDLTMPKTATN